MSGLTFAYAPVAIITRFAYTVVIWVVSCLASCSSVYCFTVTLNKFPFLLSIASACPFIKWHPYFEKAMFCWALTSFLGLMYPDLLG